MIAIFDKEKDAVACSDKIHKYLKENRPGYNAEKWSEIEKSDIEELWAVKMPLEQTKKMWAKEMVVAEIAKAVSKVEKYAEDWKIKLEEPTEELIEPEPPLIEPPIEPEIKIK